MMQLKRRATCDLCAGQDILEVMESSVDSLANLNFSASDSARLKLGLSKCNTCKLVFATYALNQQILTANYSDSSEIDHALEFENRTKSFIRALLKLRTMREMFQLKHQSILDIGCAEGSFVNAGKRIGLDVRGVEPSHELVEWGVNNHQLRITQGDYQTYTYDDAPYDLVTLWDVIEHVESPSHLLEQMRRVIKEGGLLLINTPIIDSWQAKTMSKNWPFLLNVHTFYYSGRTLTEHCSKFGFQLVENRKYSQTLSLGFLLLRFGFPLKLSKPLFPIPLRYSLGQQTFLFRREIND